MGELHFLSADINPGSKINVASGFKIRLFYDFSCSDNRELIVWPGEALAKGCFNATVGSEIKGYKVELV